MRRTPIILLSGLTAALIVTAAGIAYAPASSPQHVARPAPTRTVTTTVTATRTVTQTVTATATVTAPGPTVTVTAPGPTTTVTVTATPSSTPTDTGTPTPTPTPTPTTTAPGTWQCVTSSPSGNCGAYDYAGITNSNGYNTYVGNNCWADPQCHQTVSANSPGDWQVVSTEPAGNTSVKTYPNVQQLTNNWPWAGSGCGGSCSDAPIAGLSTLTSSYAETTPRGGTIAQFAWDIWLSNTSGSNEIMVWVDNSNRGNGGSTQIGTAAIGGQAWTLYEYGGPGGEIIWSLGAPGTFAQQPSGIVDLLALLHDLQTRGIVPAGASIGQIDAGWEICSTGGGPETFTVSNYTVTAN